MTCSNYSSLHGKPYFLFPDVLKRWSFQKNRAGIWSFSLVLSTKMIFPFLENMILPPDGKHKMIFLKKIHENMIFSSNVLKRWSFQKGSRWDMIFLVLSGNVVLFSQKHGILSLDGKWETDDLSQEIHGNMIFSI